MSLKALAAAGLAAISVAAFAPAADAKTNIYLGVGPGFYDSDCDWIGHRRYCGGPHLRRHQRYYLDDFENSHDWEDSYSDDRVGCGEAKEIVRDRGFRKVKTRDCDGRVYTFTGRKRGDLFVIKVNAFTGRVISASRI